MPKNAMIVGTFRHGKVGITSTSPIVQVYAEETYRTVKSQNNLLRKENLHDHLPIIEIWKYQG